MKLIKLFFKKSKLAKDPVVTVIEQKQLQKIIGGTLNDGGPRQTSASDASAGAGSKE